MTYQTFNTCLLLLAPGLFPEYLSVGGQDVNIVVGSMHSIRDGRKVETRKERKDSVLGKAQFRFQRVKEAETINSKKILPERNVVGLLYLYYSSNTSII